MTENPFRPPSSELLTETPLAVGGLIQGGRALSASHGRVWFAAGFRMTVRAPLQWLAILLVFMLVTVALSVIPIVSLLSYLLMPVFLGGVMLGCHTLAHGGPLELAHLFAGFDPSRRSGLLMIGVLYLAGTTVLILGGVILALGGVVVLQLTVGADVFEAQPFLTGALLVVFLIALTLGTMALGTSLWFAPALVTLSGMPAFDAMRMSVAATLRNVMPFMVYGLVVLGLNLLASVLLGVVTAGAIALISPKMVAPVTSVVIVGGAVLVLFAMLPSIWSAMYVSYRDVFVP